MGASVWILSIVQCCRPFHKPRSHRLAAFIDGGGISGRRLTMATKETGQLLGPGTQKQWPSDRDGQRIAIYNEVGTTTHYM